jgi:hypothetical protein
MLRGLIYGFVLCAIAAAVAALMNPMTPEPAAGIPAAPESGAGGGADADGADAPEGKAL